MNFKKQIFGFMDMLRFKKLVPTRRQMLAQGENKPLPQEYRTNVLAKKLHPGYMQVELVAARPLTETIRELTFKRVDSDAFGMRDQYRKQLAGILEQHEIYSVFPEVVVCKDFDKALYIFLQSHLVGPLKPNIVMMGFPDNEERIDQNIRHIRTIQTLHMSCVMMHNFDRYRRLLRRVVRGRVDIWWRGTNNISLMLILANLLVNDPLWQGTTLRILRVAETEKEAGELRDELEGIVESARIKADTCVFVTAEPFYLVLRRESADASAIFIGLCPPDSDEEFHKIFQRFNIMLDGMAPAFVVTSSGGADLRA